MLNLESSAYWYRDEVFLVLRNKKDRITESLNENGIDICAIQETEIPMNYPENTTSWQVSQETLMAETVLGQKPNQTNV